MNRAVRCAGKKSALPALLTLFALFPSLSSCATQADRKTASSIEAHERTELQARIERLNLRPEHFFFSPKNEEERSFHRAGVLQHWKMYQKTASPDGSRFKGYTLFADPYHRGMGRISFLLGSDCSNFIHRTFQILGANYPFMKTRHWIHLARALESGDPLRYYRKQNSSGVPIDMKECTWVTLTRVFRLVPRNAPLVAGDVVIYPGKEGVLGIRGHVGFLSGDTHSPLVLQSRYPDGIVALPIEKGPTHFLRYTGRIARPLPTSIKHALNERYSESAAPQEDACGNSGDQLQ
jgi:hypothetical protein